MRTEIFKLFRCFDFSTPYIKVFFCENHKKHRSMLWGNTDFLMPSAVCRESYYRAFKCWWM